MKTATDWIRYETADIEKTAAEKLAADLKADGYTVRVRWAKPDGIGSSARPFRSVWVLRHQCRVCGTFTTDHDELTQQCVPCLMKPDCENVRSCDNKATRRVDGIDWCHGCGPREPQWVKS